jgi:hypothetical protein
MKIMLYVKGTPGNIKRHYLVMSRSIERPADVVAHQMNSFLYDRQPTAKFIFDIL